jgi:hypothetical protein
MSYEYGELSIIISASNRSLFFNLDDYSRLMILKSIVFAKAVFQKSGFFGMSK